MSLTWRPLPLPSSPGLPVLLVSAQVGVASYTVRITDMANMWVESLERKAICMRAWSENTTIDPSDTPENMAKFLASLTSALDPRQPGHGDTSLGLVPTATDDAGDDGLTLRVTCALPGFAPLKWPLHLGKCPPSAVATQLVLPLIEAHYARKREVESLLQALGQKDSVLTKLSDKLEAMGIGLEHVFTALSGKKMVTRLAADDKVRGLAPFDRRRWEADMSHDMDGPGNTGDLVQSVLGNSSLRYGNLIEMDASPVLDRWWHDFRDTSQVASCKKARPATPSSQTRSPRSGPRTTEDDDDFQVQATPPRLESQAGKHKAAGDAAPAQQASSTTDEDGDESLIPYSNPPPTVPTLARQSEPRKAASSILGSMGGKKPSAAPRPPGSETEQRAEQPVDDSETASEASDDDDATASAPGSPPPPAAMSTTSGVRKGGLGLIGGGALRKNNIENEKCREAEVGVEDGVPARNKLGVIGNKTGRGPPSSTPAQEESERGRTPARVEKEDPAGTIPRETSQERADRRREDLKRDLEKRAAASPARKKRRF
ncbi:XRcc4-like factor, NHEJ component [Hirsutella rhossiliensis]|uniref:Non-homologous end-joining factor 1 n=1 Tax=Hirsutella rhossiliensis TaxID=111463 RepID=A0A9P8MVZ1_9HYPO|nr:XLF-Cernunnos, XRcc4-like factor, NHEJ component protein [Hirsutella rhossiliensis]KAH0962275.1 XLF-Cernunnos, XRcc4-like factor, NHEJ component protein [Hirsutella rhossiliensis]